MTSDFDITKLKIEDLLEHPYVQKLHQVINQLQDDVISQYYVKINHATYMSASFFSDFSKIIIESFGIVFF